MLTRRTLRFSSAVAGADGLCDGFEDTRLAETEWSHVAVDRLVLAGAHEVRLVPDYRYPPRLPTRRE